MTKGKKGLKKVPINLEDKDSYTWLSNKPSIKMPDGEVISPREYKRRFDAEWHNADFYTGEENIIKDEKIRSEAIRNYNSSKRDALSVAEKTGSLAELTPNEAQFMQDASNEWEWQEVYKRHGYAQALKTIIEQTVKEIENKNIAIRVTLSRFIVKVLDLRRVNARRKNPKKRKTNEES